MIMFKNVVTIRRIAAAAGLACAAALALSGCAATSFTGSTAVPADQTAAKKKKKPEPVKLSMPTFDAFRGDGIFFFDDNLRSRLYVSDKIAVNGRWPVLEDFDRGATHGFTWGAGAATVLRNGVAQALTSASTISVEKSGAVILHYGDAGKRGTRPLNLRVKLTAYDLSGLPIGPYLRTRADRATPAGWLIGKNYVFPEGSVGYRATVSTDVDEVLVPTRNAFTGSATIEDFSKRFTKDIPYCLRFLPSKRAEPLGIRFPEPIAKKTKTVKDRRGRTRTEEVAQTGEVSVYPVKKNTLFCAASGSQLASARWDLRYVNGTRAIAFTFPPSVNPGNYGIQTAHAKALKPAFAEEKITDRRGRTVRQVRPAALWEAGEPVLDAQWRFNAVAADAVTDAIARTADKRAEWEREQKEREKALRAAK